MNRTMGAITAIEAGKPGMSLDIPKGQTFDQWVEMGRSLCEGQKVVNWWIGDWWAAGTHRYGERAKAAAQGIFGREFGGLMNLASVCRAFETSRRREALSFTHHVEVSALPPEEADALLERAEADGLSTRDLRVEAMKRRVALGHFPTRDVGDDDPEHTELMEITRKWNRARRSARETFLDLANEANLGVIDA
jgi:hypothetical protein